MKRARNNKKGAKKLILKGQNISLKSAVSYLHPQVDVTVISTHALNPLVSDATPWLHSSAIPIGVFFAPYKTEQ